MTRRIAAAALTAACACLLSACGGEGGSPTLPSPPCNEEERGDFYCGGWPGERVVRTAEEHAQLMAFCTRGWWPPDLEPPPVPGDGEMLLVVSDGGSGCEGCLAIACVEERDDEVVVLLEGGFFGDCEAFIMPGAWVTAPDPGLPIRFEREEAECLQPAP